MNKKDLTAIAIEIFYEEIITNEETQDWTNSDLNLMLEIGKEYGVIIKHQHEGMPHASDNNKSRMIAAAIQNWYDTICDDDEMIDWTVKDLELLLHIAKEHGRTILRQDHSLATN